MDLRKLEDLVGHVFRDRSLLERALAHRSWANEKQAPGVQPRDSHNESLEFVGDSVLGLVIAEHLFRTYPELDEGALTMMKHRLVSTETLARIAGGLGLGEHLKLGRGEERSGGRSKTAILADALEAVFGAVFFDAGYSASAESILKVYEDELKETSSKGSQDFKTMLQERLQARKLTAPRYSLIRAEGMPHSRTFVVEAAWEGGRTLGTGRSIKSAEMMAANEALAILEKADDEPTAHLNAAEL